MTRRLAVFVAVAAFAGTGPGDAAATNECRGLMVCVPIAGPWVVVPVERTTPRPRVEFQLRCPRGYIVGGLDAELSERAIDVTFSGALGSPVNPGITTADSAVFSGVYVGAGAPAASFRPHIGCIPASGGGGRRPTAVTAVPPGKPTVRRVWAVRPLAGRALRRVYGCRAGERLVAASHAVGLYTRRPPDARLAAAVTVTRSLRSGRVVVAVRAGQAVRGVRAVVQVHAVCTRAER